MQNVNPPISADQGKRKICPRCWVEKPHSEFHKQSRNINGIVCYCKSCVKKEHQEIYTKNKDKILKMGKMWHENNKEKHAELGKKWRRENPERAREIGRKSAARFRSTSEGRAKSIAWTKNWDKNNPWQKKEYMKNYCEENKDRIGELKRKTDVARLYGLDVIDYYIMIEKQNNQCYICGKPPKKNSLGVDHDHKTGKIRKLLCHGCNHEIGVIEKGEESLIRLLKYLAEHNSDMAIKLLNKLED